MRRESRGMGGKNMTGPLSALLVRDHPDFFAPLKRTLWELCVETYSVETCKETEGFIAQYKPPIISTESALRDGSWLSILKIVEADDVPVIIVGGIPHARSPVSPRQMGAFDVLAPPFEHETLGCVVKSAERVGRRWRDAPARSAVASPWIST